VDSAKRLAVTAYFTRGNWLQWKTPNRAPNKEVGYKPLVRAACQYPGEG